MLIEMHFIVTKLGGEREIFHLFVLIVSLSVTEWLHHMLDLQMNTQHTKQPQVGRYRIASTELLSIRIWCTAQV